MPGLSKEDYYMEGGNVIFTEKFHLKRGKCCGNKCKHCPYDGVKGSRSHGK